MQVYTLPFMSYEESINENRIGNRKRKKKEKKKKNSRILSPS